ncbi:MAG: hypothetical protein K1X54_01875 [Flavobacteriales bacterium]|nr:hypothetical protein [Flavobacteriales bacterium]
MKKRTFFLMTIAGLMLFISSCKKEQQTAAFDAQDISNESTSSFVEKSLTVDEDAATMRGGTGGLQNNCNWQELLPECAVVTESGDTYPKTITIDYGDGCAQGDFTKSGMITIVLTNDMMNQGAVRTVTFQNYHINNTSIEGSRVLTNTGNDESGHPVFHREVNTVISRNGNTFTRTADEMVTWFEGYDTDACGDNKFFVTGSGTTTRDDGTVRTRSIISPLIIDRVCGYITQGVVEILGPHGNGSINFGDGTCDDEAMVTRPNGNTQLIHLNHP